MAPKVNKKTFAQRKELAKKLYGVATVRPQDIMKNFLFARRQVNYNSKFLLTHPNIEGVQAWLPTPDILKPFDTATLGEYEYVDTEETFARMITDLQGVTAIALDTEGHDEHSYSGMISLIQLATKNQVYILDPFKLCSKIQCELKEILQDPAKIIVVHGGDNDFLWLKRDFSIYVIGAIDIQTLHQQKFGGNPAAYDTLVKEYLKIDGPEGENKKVAQLADWTKRPLSSSLLKYAANDVSYLLKIWEHLVKNEESSLIKQAVIATKKKVLAAYGYKKFKSAKEELLSVRKNPILSTSQMLLFELLWEWRNQHAAKMDEKPKELISTHVLIYLVKNPPATEEKVVEAFSGRVPPMLQKAVRTIIRLVSEGRPYFEKILQTKCNNCGELGHAAYACYKPNSAQNTKRFYDQHPDLKRKQNQRRAAKKLEKQLLRQGQIIQQQ